MGMTICKNSKGYFAGGKFQIYVPAEVVSDSQFPFKANKGAASVELNVKISGAKLVIEKR